VKRLLRTLLTIARALSALLCAAAVVLWVRSHFVIDYFERASAAGPAPVEVQLLAVKSARGGISVIRISETVTTLDASANAAWDEWRRRFATGVYWAHEQLQVETDDASSFEFTRWQGHKVSPWSPSATVKVDDLRIGSPYWFIAAVTAILPAYATLRHFGRRHLTKIGHCVKCGYDLRATPDRCPECGTPARR
jgi:hypothetical protein